MEVIDDAEGLPTSDDDFPSPTKKKVRLKAKKNSCCIHCSNDSGKLYSPQSMESWKVLLSAAIIRKESVLLELSKDINNVSDLSAVKYHRNCRSIFTMKSKLDIIEQQNVNISSQAHSSTEYSEGTDTARRASMRSSDKKWAGDLLPAICIFCEKKSKYSSSSRTREELITCSDDRGDSQIRRVALAVGDSRVIALLSTGHDAMSAEAQYHKSCYKKYTKQSSELMNESESGSDLYNETGYVNFFCYIDNFLFTREIQLFSEISDQFEICMRSAGAVEAIESRKKNLRRILDKRYKNQLHFVETQNGRLLVCPEDLEREELIVQNFDLTQRLKKAEQQQSDIIPSAAKLIRNDIHALKASTHPLESSSLPATCRDFLGMLLSAWDNIDRCEETLSGAGTTHRVNGIIVQPGVRPSECSPLVIDKRKSRSLNLLADTEFLPPYISGSRVGPDTTVSVQPDYSTEVSQGKSLTLSWVIQRFNNKSNQTVPSWTGFNVASRSNIEIQESTLGYLPTVNFPATDMSTVLEVMQRSMLIKESLSLQTICCTFDQALYAKAAEIVWRNTKEYEGVILLLGDFHLLCNYIGVIGKRFGDAGLRDILVESGVIAQGSVDHMLAGKHYNRAIRAYKIVYEALMRIMLCGFIEHVGQDDRAVTLRDRLHTYADTDCTQQEEIYQKFEEYKQNIRDSHGSTACLWLSYVDMVDVLLNHIRSVREGNWSLYLATLRQILPWFFSYDHVNYARYAPVYYFDMLNLQEKFPDVYEAFSKGYFSVQLPSTSSFSRLPVDEVIERTINLDTQTAGGTKGFSKKSKTVEKYYLTCDARSLFTRYLNEMSESRNRRHRHTDLFPSRIRKDECDVTAVLSVLTQDWINPFLPSTEMIIISTGVSVPIEVSNDLQNAYTKGEEAFQSFSNQVLSGHGPSEHFFDRITKMKLKTCSDVVKKKKINVSGREIALKADRNLFAKMALIAKKRNLNMRTVLNFPLGPIPLSIGNPDGSMRKTQKSSLLTALSSNTAHTEIMSGRQACIIDGMCLVRRVVNVPETFGQLADVLLSMLLAQGYLSERIDIVFDVYRDISIKNSERSRRSDTFTTKTYQTLSANHKITEWRSFLTSGCNKSVLVKFLYDYWSQSRVTEKLRKEIFITVESNCFHLSSKGTVEVIELISEQEEADTRVLLHAKHAAESGFSIVVIHADDTDIAVIALSFIPEICATGTVLYMKSGTQNRIKYINLSALHTTLGNEICDALIGFHALTGCDTVSSFCGRGKVKAYSCLKKNLHLASSLSLLGQNFHLSEEVYGDIEKFVCCLYGCSQTNFVNDARYGLFCGKKGSLECQNLPPCQSSLRLHISRANYQAAIWRRALEPNPDIPSADGFGWAIADGGIKIVWMTCAPAPDSILEFMSCCCPRDCTAPSCTCVTHGLPCTDMCRKSDCSNARDRDLDSTDTRPNIYEDSDSESDASSDEEIDPQNIEEDCEIDNVIDILSDEMFFDRQ